MLFYRHSLFLIKQHFGGINLAKMYKWNFDKSHRQRIIALCCSFQGEFLRLRNAFSARADIIHETPTSNDSRVSFRNNKQNPVCAYVYEKINISHQLFEKCV